jgi:peptide/nickel transport system permease protein
MMAYWGLDRPLFEQYVLFWRPILAGRFGLCLLEWRPVEINVGECVTHRLLLLVGTLLVTIMIGVPAGVAAVVWRKSTLGRVMLAVAFIGYLRPDFILAMKLIMTCSSTLHWLLISGATSSAHFIMPTINLSSCFAAALARFTRNAMLTALSQDYIRIARAKGLGVRPPTATLGARVEPGRDYMASASETEMRRITSSRIAMIFQEPMTSLSSVLCIGA